MRIRPFESGDLERIRTLTIEGFDGVSIESLIERRWPGTSELGWGARKFLEVESVLATHPTSCFVAELDGRVVGYITNTVDQEKRQGHVRDVAVDRDVRGRGIGRELLQHTIAEFGRRGLAIARIETLSHNSVGAHLYPEVGFQLIAGQNHYALKLDNTASRDHVAGRDDGDVARSAMVREPESPVGDRAGRDDAEAAGMDVVDRERTAADAATKRRANPVPRLPEVVTDERALDELLTEPTDDLVAAMAALDGDLLILGAGGKMGPTLARLARRASDAAGSRRRVIGVSRFSETGLERRMRDAGVDTIACDLLEGGSLERLPDAANVVFMAGRKFGSSGSPDLTWAMNVDLPARVARRYRRSRVVVFSTGNVYPLTPVSAGGSSERDPVGPVGEYAQSCLGRERMFEHVANQFGTQVAIIRLNYAIDLRYGILLDVATKVWNGEPVDVTMGNANVIWQGDANRVALRAFSLCAGPPDVLNLTGPETISIRSLAARFGELLGKAPTITGEEAPTALLSNASRAHALFGYPRVPLDTMVRWVAHWVMRGGRALGKPTHFEVRDGRF